VPLYLGFDCGTQSLGVIVLDADDARRDVVFERALEFDRDFPEFETRGGVLRSDDALVVHAPPLLWVEALDRAMALVARESGLDLSRVAAISGSAQQHGTVYLDAAAATALDRADSGRPLAAQLENVFSRPTAPVWMDASTRAECHEITAGLGGPEAVARLTGSRATERFAGPQIRKFWRRDPAGYARTHRVHLVSSFLASLLAGRHAGVDRGDGSGMNLMDLAAGEWAPRALDATAPDLAKKLPPLVPSWSDAGTLAPYWMKRYGFPAARVIVWSGDNPCSQVGTGLIGTDRIGISLGTSDTVFAPLGAPAFDPSGSGNVFGSPAGGFLSLVCCRNGSLARERVRDEAGLDWAGFSAALRSTPAGNRGAIMLPWFEPEVTPPVATPGARAWGLDPTDRAARVRAVVEGQMLALALHSRWMGVTPAVIHATGGAAANREILRVMAEVWNAEVDQLAVGNSACLGAALRAFHGDRAAAGQPLSWKDVIEGFVTPVHRVRPDPGHVAVYKDVLKLYAALEAEAL